MIIVVVDRLSKYCHLGSLPASHSALSVAEFDLLHRILKKMASNRDKVVLNKFWWKLFIKSGTTLSMSTAYHPGSDGQTEIVNKTIEVYLQVSIHDNKRRWVELWYNRVYHHSLGTSPF